MALMTCFCVVGSPFASLQMFNLALFLPWYTSEVESALGTLFLNGVNFNALLSSMIDDSTKEEYARARFLGCTSTGRYSTSTGTGTVLGR